MSITFPDSAEKMILLLSEISTEPVHIKGKTINRPYPRTFKISNTFWREFICPGGCVACCKILFSIDYLPEEFEKFVPENRKQLFNKRTLTVNGVTKELYTIEYNNSKEGDCTFLIDRRTDNENVKGCELYPNPPLSCIAGPQVKFMTRKSSKRTYLTKRPFGRAWAFPEEPKCKFIPNKDKDYKEETSILKRFRDWARYFEMNTVIDYYIKKVENAQYMEQDITLRINYNKLIERS